MDRSTVERTRIKNRWPIAREGLPFIGTGLVIAAVLFLFHLKGPAVVFVLFALFAFFFFRDPERAVEVPANTVLAPADGKVIDVAEFEDTPDPLGGPAVRVSIFMSLFNVHVNRVPVSGRVAGISYHPGKFFAANLDKSSKENESNRIVLEAETGGRLMVVQIAGLVARRIVCRLKENDRVVSGERFGLIRFGSRLDVYMPRKSRIRVRTGDHVRAGQTPLGDLPC